MSNQATTVVHNSNNGIGCCGIIFLVFVGALVIDQITGTTTLVDTIWGWFTFWK